MIPQYRIEFSPKAFAELLHIYAYIAQDSTEHAQGMIEKILAGIDGLENFPRRQKVHDPSGRIAGEVFSLPVPPYVVFFRISETESVVRIARVRHGAQRRLKRI